MVIICDILYNDFDTIIANFLETRDNKIDQIQSILQSKEVENLSKRLTRTIEDLVIAFRDNKHKATNSYKKCFYCHKFNYFG